MEEENFLKMVEGMRIIMVDKKIILKKEEEMYDFYHSLVKMPEFILDIAFNFNGYIEIKQSSIHGMGVFAKQNIKKGSVITIYPCDSLINEKAHLSLISSPSDEQLKKYESTYKLCCGDYSIVGFPENRLFHGHLINDACPCANEISIELAKGVNCQRFIKSSIKYMVKSLDRINCKPKYNETVAYIVASRDISCGEEIYMSYGLLYWSQLLNTKLHKQYWSEYFNGITDNQKQYISKLYYQFFPQN